jgi:hypothetical protein
MAAAADFAEVWGRIYPRLTSFLRGRGAVGMSEEDLAQETAARLLAMWPKVDPKTAWPLTVTIALNLIRDGYRTRRDILPLEEVGESVSLSDTEAQVMSRIELSRVGRAMRSMNPRYRTSLLNAVQDDAVHAAEPHRMVRARARRQLLERLERVSAVVVGWWNRANVRWRDTGWESMAALSTGLQAAAAAVVIATAVVPASTGPKVSTSEGMSAPSQFSTRVSAVYLRDAAGPYERVHTGVPGGSTRSADVNKRPSESPEDEGTTLVTVEGQRVDAPPSSGEASSDGSQTQASAGAEAGGQKVERDVEANHEPPDCTAEVGGDGADYSCTPGDPPSIDPEDDPD